MAKINAFIPKSKICVILNLVICMNSNYHNSARLYNPTATDNVFVDCQIIQLMMQLKIQLIMFLIVKNDIFNEIPFTPRNSGQ